MINANQLARSLCRRKLMHRCIAQHTRIPLGHREIEHELADLAQEPRNECFLRLDGPVLLLRRQQLARGRHTDRVTPKARPIKVRLCKRCRPEPHHRCHRAVVRLLAVGIQRLIHRHAQHRGSHRLKTKHHRSVLDRRHPLAHRQARSPAQAEDLARKRRVRLDQSHNLVKLHLVVGADGQEPRRHGRERGQRIKLAQNQFHTLTRLHAAPRTAHGAILKLAAKV